MRLNAISKARKVVQTPLDIKASYDDFYDSHGAQTWYYSKTIHAIARAFSYNTIERRVNKFPLRNVFAQSSSSSERKAIYAPCVLYTHIDERFNQCVCSFSSRNLQRLEQQSDWNAIERHVQEPYETGTSVSSSFSLSFYLVSIYIYM